MAKYHNKELTQKLGIKRERERVSLEIEDIAELTGFHRNVIIGIENGNNTDVSHIVEIGFALGLHPKSLFDISLKIKPRFSLSATRKEKSRLTSRIKTLYHKGFFNLPKSTSEVYRELNNQFDKAIKTDTKSLSVILNRLSENGLLTVSKKDGKRFNYYRKK